MKAVTVPSSGGPEVLRIETLPDPVPGAGEVLIDVAAAGLNNADLLQRRGLYPPPVGASPLLGLEISGRVAALGAGVTRWKVGESVMALLGGGGYAEKVVVDSGALMRLPTGLSWEQAAAIPEAFLTAWLELVTLGRLREGETVLIHAAASGVGKIGRAHV